MTGFTAGLRIVAFDTNADDIVANDALVIDPELAQLMASLEVYDVDTNEWWRADWVAVTADSR